MDFVQHQHVGGGERLVQADKYLNMTVAPVLIACSLSGNLLAVLVLIRKPFQSLPMSVYLTFLAVVDSGTVMAGLLPRFVLAVTDYDMRGVTERSCQTHVFSMYLFTQLSAWTLVVVTSERVVSIILPHKVKVLCTKSKSCLVLAAAILLVASSNIPIFFLLGRSPVTSTTAAPVVVPSTPSTSSPRTAPASLLTAPSSPQTAPSSPRTTQSSPHTAPSSPRTTPSSPQTAPSSPRKTPLSVQDAYDSSRLPRGISRMHSTVNSSNGHSTMHPTVNSSNGHSTMHPTVNSSNATSAYRACAVKKVSGTNMYVFFTLQFLKQCLLPFLIILILNVIIIVSLLRRRRLLQRSHRQEVATVTSDGSLVIRTKTGLKKVISRRDASLSVILVTVNAVFIVCTFPIGIYQQLAPNIPERGIDNPRQVLIYTVLVMVLYLNNTLNFVLYYVTGSRFRTELKEMLACFRS